MNNCKNCGANSFLNDTCQYCGSVELKEKKITALDGKNCTITGKNNTSLI